MAQTTISALIGWASYIIANWANESKVFLISSMYSNAKCYNIICTYDTVMAQTTISALIDWASYIIANWANDSKVFLISSMYSNTAKRAYMEVMESWWKHRGGGYGPSSTP